MKKNQIRHLVLAALLVAVGFVLPFLTGQIPEVGSMLLPLHLPALIAGFVCGWPWGLAVGAVLPLMRSFLMGMPPMIPTAVCMTFEMAAYGAAAGLLYRKCNVYVSLIGAMVIGRLVWGVASWAVYGLLMGKSFSLAMFWAGGFVNAWPGMILQLIAVQLIVKALKKAKLEEK